MHKARDQPVFTAAAGKNEKNAGGENVQENKQNDFSRHVSSTAADKYDRPGEGIRRGASRAYDGCISGWER